MNDFIKHSSLIESAFLFWGNSRLEQILSPEERNKLCDLEMYDWLSSLYWGEGLAVNYSLKMSEISDNKEKWLKVYRDELRHQTMLGNWFIERGFTPLPKSKLIGFSYKIVDRMNESMSEDKLVESMYSTQVLLEELFHALLKLRLNHLKDRDLKSIFYQIFIDEADHLGRARSEIKELNQIPKKPYQMLEENKTRLFPLDIARDVISSEKISMVKDFQEQIVTETIEEARSNVHLYRPLPILHQFQKIPGYNCVACSPKRADGLHLEPKFNEATGLVEDTYVFPKRCEGFNSVVHGGFISMVLDEIMCYSPILSRNLLPLTRSMNVTFKKPVMVGETYKLEGQVIEAQGQIVVARSFIKDMNGVIHAECEGKLYVPTKVQAPLILGRLGEHEAVQAMFI